MDFKKPDLSSLTNLTKKFDLGGIVNSVKSIITPGGQTPTPQDPSDVLGNKMAELSLLLQDLAAAQSEQAKKLAEANQRLNEIFALIRAQTPAKEPAPSPTKVDVKLQEVADNEGMPTSKQEEKMKLKQDEKK